jgi:hypothetical protein
MSSLPQLHSKQRTPRVRLQSTTPAVIRFQDGQSACGKLQIVSLTGGLLSLPSPLDQGSHGKLMFLTSTGSVLGGVEMLRPVASSLQPFRFVSLAADDHRRLGTIIHAALHPSCPEPAWMEKLRAASSHRHRSRRRLFKWTLTALGLVSLSLAGALYLLRSPFLK